MPRSSKNIAPVTQLQASAPSGLYVGTSGWAYPSWKPGFYPKEVPSRSFLEFYATQLTAVEVNYTFRALPRVSQLEGWLAATPPGFRFSFKAPQRITHFARLQNCDELLRTFVESLEPVRDAGRLGPVLFQLPPNMKADAQRLRSFLTSPPLTENRSLRIAFEFRHSSWFDDEVFDLLRASNAALCVADTDDLQTPEVSTADFCCYRLRRDGGYELPEIKQFAERFATFSEKSGTFVFLRHQDEPTGALQARHLLAEAAKVLKHERSGEQE